MNQDQEDEEAKEWARLRNLSPDKYIEQFNVYYADLLEMEEDLGGLHNYLVIGRMNGGGANPYQLNAPTVVAARNSDIAFLKQVMTETGGEIKHILTREAINRKIDGYMGWGNDPIPPYMIIMDILFEDRIDETGRRYLGENIYDYVIRFDDICP